VRKADNLPPSCAIVTKSGNLNFLEPYGPVPVMGLLYFYLHGYDIFTCVLLHVILHCLCIITLMHSVLNLCRILFTFVVGLADNGPLRAETCQNYNIGYAGLLLI